MEVLQQAVTGAILSSHRHPEAIDFAVVQAAAVCYALNSSTDGFDAQALLASLSDVCETEVMKEMIQSTAKIVEE